MLESSIEPLLSFLHSNSQKYPMNTLDRSDHRSHIVDTSMMRTPSIVGPVLVAALLSMQLPVSAQVPAQTPPPPAAAPAAPAQPTPPPAAAMPSPTVAP